MLYFSFVLGGVLLWPVPCYALCTSLSLNHLLLFLVSCWSAEDRISLQMRSHLICIGVLIQFIKYHIMRCPFQFGCIVHLWQCVVVLCLTDSGSDKTVCFAGRAVGFAVVLKTTGSGPLDLFSPRVKCANLQPVWTSLSTHARQLLANMHFAVVSLQAPLQIRRETHWM